MATTPIDTPASPDTTSASAQMEVPLELNASLWQSDTLNGAAPAEINISDQLDQALKDPDQVEALLDDAGFGSQTLDSDASAQIKNLKATLAAQEAGRWDGSIYTPTWDAAFSAEADQPIYFDLSYDIEVTYNANDADFLQTVGSVLVVPWTTLLALHLDRSGVDYTNLLTSQTADQPAITIQSANGAGILIAFGSELQTQRGLKDELITVALTNGDVLVPFSEAQLNAVMTVIGDQQFISPPNAPGIGVKDDVGSILGSLSPGDFTDDANPTITLDLNGTNARTGDLIEIFNGASQFGDTHQLTDQDIAAGTVELGLGSALADGSYALTARITRELEGQEGERSATFSFVVDTLAPPAPEINPLTGDNFINVEEKTAGITLRGRSEPGSSVSVQWLQAGSTKRTDATETRADGTWEIKLDAGAIPPSGTYTLRVVAQDAAGNISTETSIDSVIVDAGNLAPTDLRLASGAGIDANKKTGDVIATLIGTDPDSKNLTYSLNNENDFDNRFFEVDSNSGAVAIKGNLSQNEFDQLITILNSDQQSLSISARVSDNGSPPLSLSKLIRIPIVTPGNTAPSVSNTETNLNPVTENSAAASISGKSIVDLVTGSFNDPGDELGGIALVANQSTSDQGTWQYKAENTSNWITLPALSESNPFLLLPDDQVRFVPSRNYSGSPGKLSLRLLDDSRVWTRGRLPAGELLATGGSNAASENTLDVGIEITDTPTSPNNLSLAYLNNHKGIPENRGSFAKLTGSDLDTNTTNLRYSLESTDPPELFNNFTLDAQTGELALINTLNGVNSVSFTVKVDDQTGSEPLIRTFTLGVLTGDNTSPTARTNKVDLGATSNNPPGEKLVAPSGRSVTDLFGGDAVFSDPEQAFQGVAVVANKASSLEGVWQYTNGSGTFINFPVVSEASPLLIKGTDRIRFLPRPGFSGEPGSLSVRLLDSSTDYSTGLLTSGPLVVGGSGAASSELITLTTTVSTTTQSPLAIALVESEFNRTVGTTIAGVVVNDPDTRPEDITLTLSGDDAGLLRLEGSQIKINNSVPADKTSLSFSVTATDGTGALTRSFTVQSNRAPEVDLAAEAADRPNSWAPTNDPDRLPRQVYLNEVQQGSAVATLTGETVSNLFGSRLLTPEDGDLFPALAGVAIVANAAASDPRAGRWDYQLNGGSFTALPTVSEGNPFLLPSTARLRFRPNQQFSGVPPALSVRLLDNSITIPGDGRLAGVGLIAGGSGAASADILVLLTNIAPLTGQAPQSVSFAAAREILVSGQNPETAMVAGGTLLGRFTAFDPDSSAGQLSYRHNLDPNLYEVVNGNELRIKNGAQVTQSQLESLGLIVTVEDEGGRPLSSTAPFSIPRGRFTTSADTLARTESVVLPLVANSNSSLNQAVQLSVTGLDGAFSVETAAVLKDQDIQALNLNLGLGSQELKEIVPLAPLLDFTVNAGGSGEVVRFEFELPRLSFDELSKIRYLKLLSDGTYDIFSYEIDAFGIGTGARLEQRRGNDFAAIDSTSFTADQPTFLAVYVQDNARGDGDLSLGIVRDPGLPMLLTTVVTPPPVTPPQPPSGGGGGGGGGAPSMSTAPTTVTLAPNETNYDHSGNNPVVVIANDQDNRVTTGAGNDRITLGKGNDSAQSGNGADQISGNEGADTINGNQGEDTIWGGKDNDFVRGGKDSDFVSGDKGDDIVMGDMGDDTLLGGEGQDDAYGGMGNDTINGNQDSDYIRGGKGNDSIRGGKGDDYASGDIGDDTVHGDLGHDTLAGGTGSDALYGGDGTDHLQGADASNGRGAGERDVLAGGALSDVFYLGDETGAYYIDLENGMVGFAHITDFDSQDKIALMNRDGLRLVRNTSIEGVEGSGVAIFMQDDLIAFIQGDTAAINSIDLDDESRVVRQSFADLVPAR